MIPIHGPGGRRRTAVERKRERDERGRHKEINRERERGTGGKERADKHNARARVGGALRE